MDRKKFLKTIPLLGAAGTLTLAGCSTGTGAGEIDLSGDAQILTEAAEREAVAIQTYNAAAQSGLITDDAVLESAVNYRNHHLEHLDIFNELIEETGNQTVVLENFGPDSRVSGVNDQESVILLAMTLEMEAAQAYFEQAISTLQGQNARQRMGEIFPIEVAHYTSLKAALGRNPAINAATFIELDAGN